MKIINENEIKQLVESGDNTYLYQDFGAIKFEITLSRDEDGFDIEIVGQGMVLGAFGGMGNGMERNLIRDERSYNGNFSDDEIVSILMDFFDELENNYSLVASIKEYVDELGECYRIAKSLLD